MVWFVTAAKPTDWIVAFAALAACAGVLFVFLQLRCLARQARLQHLADYTTRHQSLVQALPEDIDTPGLVLDERPDYERTMQRMRAYFDLSFEKWYLARQRQIDADIWRIWKGGITSTLAKPAFQQAWSIIKRDTKLDPDFEGFVDQCINYPWSRLAA
ncbi:MAG TPA: hypothetical protein VFZ16_00620 [Hyphomicrobiaceae bacterium]|nr:hypothetical protein [Hyphomicrobiaceae bacterium]